MFLFFFSSSSFLFFVVGLIWFSSFFKSVAFFICSFPLSLHFLLFVFRSFCFVTASFYFFLLSDSFQLFTSSFLDVLISAAFKLKLRFETRPCGHELAFGTKSNYKYKQTKIMMNFNERTNTLLYKNIYLSHFILGVSVVFERWVETGTDCYIDQLIS